ncbi:TetR family transcriptional regulator [Streptomyces mashuensis]|uniref:TetR family transcriptional regulator n=1 Tax=Streptomyces mashuensis TaxID=33904 RepID=A0A919ECP3_9ACTN|nr:TetR/AcrR family transcriptional regulator [Streptomyces mashuensis]GHF42248.1 TetR family transcriptional regulator [Streptomyces mashuensis]
MASGGRKGTPRTSVWLAGKDEAPRRRAEGAPGEGGLDLPRIVATTVRMLDAEGLAKFSMRKLAAELGVTAMSVYWYVKTKDDLLEYAVDEVWAELDVPDPAEEGADWRDQLRAMAVTYRRVLVAHPWVPQLLSRYFNMGPKALRFSDTLLAVMRRSGVRPAELTGSLGALFQFVYGFASLESLHRARVREEGMDLDEYYEKAKDLVLSSPEITRTVPEAVELVEAREGEPIEELWQRDFELGLETVIAGIEVMRDRHRDSPQAPQAP